VLAARLATQIGALSFALGAADEQRLHRRTPTGQWSAHENAAHVARHHEVMLERLARMLAEERPELGRYRAEEDALWPRWQALSTAEVVARLRELSATLTARVVALSDAELARVGVHPSFGAMSVAEWLEFFLLHEAHHLYVILTRSR
jgi:hypothetical protein